ncbi:hypothetical protein B0H63DRAFT_539428 [Podospora didyma]|uniref:Uncharacterized protein n=1 Tax=Podospora didyma TaxID=330526 RepID=A0AAE0P036_9PEZI|nr:hypothetical protein B0H63DRAFT_539428 [Podospora didyma]
MSSSSVLSSILSTATSALSTTAPPTSGPPTSASTSTSTPTSASPSATTTAGIPNAGGDEGMSLIALVTALTTSLVIFGVQMGFFLLLRNNLARIFKPKTYLVPERERTNPPPASHLNLPFALMKFEDRDVIKKCGLDAYFFLRYLQTLLVIFIPIAFVVIPILVPLNYIGGLGKEVVNSNITEASNRDTPTGLDTLAWGNISPKLQHRRWAHLILALCVIVWVCGVFFAELRVYIKIRQDYLTSAEHRLRASANTVLVSSIPSKWLSEEALRGLFDVFPGGIRNVWMARDFTSLLSKIHHRDAIHKQLEAAETKLIREAKKKQLKQRDAEASKARKSETKNDKLRREKQEDQEAYERAQGAGGLTAGAHEKVPHIKPEDSEADTEVDDTNFGQKIGEGFARVGHGLGLGLKKGVAAVGGAGQGVLGGALALEEGVDKGLKKTAGRGGFNFIPEEEPSPANPPKKVSPQRAHFGVDDDEAPKQSFASETPLRTTRGLHAHTSSTVSQDPPDIRNFGNTTRKATNLEAMFVDKKTRFYEFWKPPTGSYASPIPQGAEGDEYPWKKEHKTFWQKIKTGIPFLGPKEPEVEYPKAYGIDYDTEKEQSPEWEKWLTAKDRPHHRTANFDWTPSWLPGLPLINKKVDTIYWCRAELARLNLEIEEDQRHPERYPVMNSAFIQFNNQVAAHMACQSVTHHVPKRMAPRLVEISPNDVIWDNMAIKWWDEWARCLIVFAIVTAMIALWAVPVAWTASLASLDNLIKKYPWLTFLKSSPVVEKAVKAITGVLPAIVLAILLALVPTLLDFLAKFQGSKTGSQKTEVVQVYYFAFLFVTVFLIVSVSLSTFQTLGENIASTPNVLAENLPKAANYFFAYMILQALSTSSGTLLQIGTLFVFFILSRMQDNTARAKWTRNTKLPSVTWGSFFPVYTNFACIALIYSVIAPLISIFAIITFGVLWVAHRYNMLYVTRFRTDTGGVLYPRAINQTFVGLYVMELCLVGLFLLARDENGNTVCLPQSFIMLVALVFTALYQYLLNYSFGPLFRYLPITFEDEAVLRDEAFQRAQDRRLGLATEDDEATSLTGSGTDEIELRKLGNRGHADTDAGPRGSRFNPRKAAHMGAWAARGPKRSATDGKTESKKRTATSYRKQRRLKDLEAQRAIGEALYGGYHDEIEDLTPEERDVLVREAFQHEALRARRPIVWLPRDDIGVSDDEIKRTNEFSEHIWISNEGTALDSKVRVVYGRNPPDFSELDIINL